MDLVYFKTHLEIDYSLANDESFEAEYTFLQANKSVDRLRQAAASVEFSEGERFIVDVLLDVKKDILRLREELELDEKYVPLSSKAYISKINFTHFKINNKDLEQSKQYYARITLNDTLIGFFFIAIDEETAKISKMRRGDESLLGTFVVDTQRANIHEKKEQNAK